MEQMQRAARRYQRQRIQLEATYAELVPMIVEARQSGRTLRAIAQVTGLSFGRIHQIEKEAQRG
jgi:DNA-directed RNA polymerase sigma subunit (sigma70/sigma32)